MVYVPIAQGTLNWDVPVNAAFVDQNARIDANNANITATNSRVTTLENNQVDTPGNHGLFAWNGHPNMFPNQTAFTAGTLHMIKLTLPVAVTATTCYLGINAGGTTLTAAQNLVGLYNSAGTLIAQTADQSVAWLSVGLKTMAFVTPVAISAGDYYLGFLSNGTTPPACFRGIGAATAGPPVMNIGQTASNASWANSGTGQTVLPASVTMSARTLAGSGWWTALS